MPAMEEMKTIDAAFARCGIAYFTVSMWLVRLTATTLFQLSSEVPSSHAPPAPIPTLSSLPSATATAAPSRANNTLMARPLPMGVSASPISIWPPPTTRIRRPFSLPHAGAWPCDSGGRWVMRSLMAVSNSLLDASCAHLLVLGKDIGGTSDRGCHFRFRRGVHLLAVRGVREI